MLKAVFIDMDNTLIETQEIYIKAQDKLLDFIADRSGFDKKDIRAHLEKTQIRLFDIYGYKTDCLIESYAATLQHFVPDAPASDITRARDIAGEVFATQARLKPGVEKAVRELSQHYELYLMTVGQQDVQQRRFDALPFKDAFNGAFIVSMKDRAAFDTALAQLKIPAEQTVMIGDSLTSDILPAVDAGMQAVYVPAQNWHAREGAGQSLPAKNAVLRPDFNAAAQDLISRKLNIGPAANDKGAPPPTAQARRRSSGGPRF